MGNPLGYQVTEYDCVPTTFINAIRHLFKRDEIPPEVVKSIYTYSLDTFNKHGKSGKKGTSFYAVQYICNWLNEYSHGNDFGIYCDLIEPCDIHLAKNSRIVECLNEGGVVVARVCFTRSLYHYILITEVDDEFVYIFDPCYREKDFRENDIEIVFNKPFKYNRKIKRAWFDSTEEKKYAMSENQERECVLVYLTCLCQRFV